MTIQDTASVINGLFRTYGLTHDVVEVDTSGYEDRLVFIEASDPATMYNLLLSFQEVFRGYFIAVPPTDQLRLF